MKNKIPVILDVDTGIDDAAAIVMACYQKELDIQLITCCFGNTDVEHSVTNTITVLEQINCQHIPVCVGESTPVNSSMPHIRAHGVNGLGGYSKPISTSALSTKYTDKMHEIVEKNDLTYIIACAPFTNIAGYIKVYPQDINKIKLIAVTALNNIDKNNPYLNFNMHIDIDSFKHVLNTIPNIIFCTSDMGHNVYIPTNEICKTAKYGATGKFLAELYPYHKDRTVKDGVALHDACAVAWLAKPDMFTISYARAKFKTNSKGAEYFSFDYNSKKPNTIVTIDINKKRFYKWYYKTLKSIKIK